MKKLPLVFFSFLIAFTSGGQTPVSTQVSLVKQLVESGHVQPRKIDDQFSSDLFDVFLESLDPSRIYFTQDDIKSLEKNRYSLDDEINNSTSIFFDAALRLYKTKLQNAQTVVNTICSKPFDFNLSEFYEAKMDSIRPASEKQLYEKWYFTLKTEVLSSLEGIASNQFSQQNKINKAEVLAKEPDVRNRVKTKYLNKLKAQLQTDADLQEELTSDYLNAFLTCMDPHSNYYNASARENFQSQLNTEGYYFGFSVANTQKGEVAITYLQPGGPAWVSGMMNKDDVLLQMKWASKDPVDLSGMDAEEVSELLDQSNTEKLELTIRKKTGEIQKVVLQKRKLENEDNIVKSYLLRGQKNIGYITLPSFYTQWEENSGSRCAADVAKEIIKLKKDSISGLILDLRFNGGGSLQEAVEMAGIFIDEGAICELGQKDGKTIVLKDMNRGVIYSGPMIVMVNGFSASASELLAGSLQDYNRALIVGSKTFGKATGQEIKQIGSDPSTKAFVKLTNLRLYRITGQSIQKQGLIPDVILPDPYGSFGEHESDNKFAIGPDSISRYKYFKPLKDIQKNGLQQLSDARVKNAKFQALDDYTQYVIQGMKRQRISLKWDDIEKEVRDSKVLISEKAITTLTTVFAPNNNSSDQKLIGNDNVANEINQRWLHRIAQDPYIEETYLIMLDLIKLN